MPWATAKPTLESDLKKLLEKAAYEATMTTCIGGAEDAAYNKGVEDNTKEAARLYAKKFAETAARPMADAIYKFAKEVEIVLTPAGLLTCPQSPAGSNPIVGTASSTKGDFKVS